MKIFIKKIIPFCKINFEILVGTAVVMKVKNSFVIAFNRNLSRSVRIIEFAKGGFCTAALLSLYVSKLVPKKRLSSALRICCYITTFFYALLGGEFETVLSLYFLTSNKIATSKF